MMSPQEIKKKIEDLQKRTEAVNKKKASYSGQLQAKKEELAKLITDIRAAGYDPKNLLSERDRAQRELEDLIISYESDLTRVENVLETYSNSQSK